MFTTQPTCERFSFEYYLVREEIGKMHLGFWGKYYFQDKKVADNISYKMFKEAL